MNNKYEIRHWQDNQYAVYSTDDRYGKYLFRGTLEEVNAWLSLKTLPDNSIDAIVTDLERFYKILPEGVILSKRTGKELAFALTHKGYLKARVFCPSLSKHIDKRKPMFLHRIIARKYLPNYSDKLQVNHINGNKTDNRIENLEMVTNQQNAIHGWTLPNKQIRLSKLFRINGKYAKRT